MVVSALAHGFLLALLFVTLPGAGRGELWGGAGGGAIQVSVVRNLPGVPLPRPAVVTQNRVASDSRALHKAPPPKPAPKETAATELERFGKESKPAPRRASRKKPERPTPQMPGNITAPGGGGPVDLPYTSFQAQATQGGMAFGAGGAFGGRYPWYVDSVRRRISSNWLFSSVDPYVQWAPRAVITFEILRDGTVVNVQMLQSSGVASVDRSALRAISASSPLDHLPSDYPGDKVMVEFWFDFHR